MPRLRLVPSKPVIDSMLRIPTRLLEGRVSLDALKKELTARYYDPQTATTTLVPLYEETRTTFSVPRAFGRKRFPDLSANAIDRTIRGVGAPFESSIEPRNEDQQRFVDQVRIAFSSDNVTDLQVCAATGAGKTYAFSKASGLVGLAPTLIIVHRNRLKEGWLGSSTERKGLRFFFGDQWVEDNVGIVQQDLCDYDGRKLVIAMAPSLCSRRYPPAFYRHFGAVGIDEIHKMATPVLHQVLSMFPARIRSGWTATPKTGEMAKVITAHLGTPAITSDQKVMQPTVYQLIFGSEVHFWSPTGEPPDSSSLVITPISRMRDRQELLTNCILNRGYRRDRQCLVLSDRTDQLLDFRKRLIAEGVPSDQIGMYVGAHKTGEFKLTGRIVFQTPGNVNISKRNIRSSIEPQFITKHLRGLEPFKTRSAAEKYVTDLKKSVRYPVIEEGYKIHPWMHKPDASEYEAIEKTSRIVLATYGIFDTGIDIARLDWGLEASPRGDVAQAVGRVLRIVTHYEKNAPEWYSVLDRLYTIIESQFMGSTVMKRYNYKCFGRLAKRREASYRKQNAILRRIENAAQAVAEAQPE